AYDTGFRADSVFHTTVFYARRGKFCCSCRKYSKLPATSVRAPVYVPVDVPGAARCQPPPISGIIAHGRRISCHRILMKGSTMSANPEQFLDKITQLDDTTSYRCSGSTKVYVPGSRPDI